MPRNGSGTYSPPINSWSPATNGVPATASDWQSILNDIRDALTQSVAKDGQTTITGTLQMGGNKLTNLGAGALPGDSLRWEQLFSQGQQADIASAATVDIGAQNTTNLNITGTTTITSFGANYNGPRFVRFAGALTLTHSAALVLPGSANITTAAGDCAVVVPNGSPTSGWRVAAYQQASYAPGAASPAVSAAIAQSVQKSGDTMTGLLVLSGDATADLNATPRRQLRTVSAMSFSNLRASATGTNANVSVSANELLVRNGSADPFLLSGVSLTINTSASGVNGIDSGAVSASTWYAVFVIYNPTTATSAGLVSTSATSPVLPSGYTHKARVGWIRTDASANKYPQAFNQFGDFVSVPNSLVQSGILSSSTAVSLASFVPTTARSAKIRVRMDGSANSSIAAGGRQSDVVNSYTGEIACYGSSFNLQATGSLVLSTPQTIYVWSGQSGNQTHLFGWEDNL